MSSEASEAKPIDISFFIDKYLIPLVERKWIVIFFFLIGLAISIVIFFIVKPEYISQATVMVEEPRSKSSEIKQEGVSTRGASKGYITAEAEKIRSSSFAAEVFKALPDETKQDFKDPLDLTSQLMGRSIDLDEELGVEDEEEGEPSTYFLKEGALLAEMFRRVGVETTGAGLIYLTARTLSPENGPVILRSYIDVWQATNLEDNTKIARAESRFAEDQRNEAQAKFEQSQKALTDFKKEYDIPVELNMARDMELQTEFERLQSQLSMDRDRLEYLDRIHVETRMQEAGIQGNVKVISYPAQPGSPSRRQVFRLIGLITMGGLMTGVGIVLLIDYIKAPIRHEKDIISVVRRPVLGKIPHV